MCPHGGSVVFVGSAGCWPAWKRKAGCLLCSSSVASRRAAGGQELEGRASVWLLPPLRLVVLGGSQGPFYQSSPRANQLSFPTAPKERTPQAQVLVGQRRRFLSPWLPAWLSPTASGRICPKSRRSKRRSGLEPGLAGPTRKRRHWVLPGLCGVVATASCFGLPGIEPTCKGPLHKGLSSGETDNQVMISSVPALGSLGGPRIPVLAAGSGETPPKALGSRQGDSFCTLPPLCW